MKTKFLLLGLIACLSYGNVLAQWSSNGSGIAYTNRVVGIGTTTPQQELHIIKDGSNADLRLQRKNSTHTDFFSGSTKAGILSYGTKSLTLGTNAREHMLINWIGNTGIGTSSPRSKLHLYGSGEPSLRLQSSNGFGSTSVQFWSDPQGSTNEWRPGYIRSVDNGNFTGGIAFITNGTGRANKTGSLEAMRVVNGRVGIGTINPGLWKLAVNGKIRAKEIKVETGWADFVFEKNYDLPTLTEVENHIKENGHLKDIPSAKDVEKNGILLGEMNSKLLQKIEELTLYTIAQEKEINALKNQKTKTLELERQMQALELIIEELQKK